VDKITKRVDRYEAKAILKAKYGKHDEDPSDSRTILNQPMQSGSTEGLLYEEPEEETSYETSVSVPTRVDLAQGLSIRYPSSLPTQSTLFSPWSMSRRHSTIEEEDGDSSSDDESNQRHRVRRRASGDPERERLLE
jgi:hypothetical protein